MTTAPTVAGKRILVVEDDYFIAKNMVRGLQRAGADVVGPAPGVDKALELIRAGSLDGAMLDINLDGEMAYAVADALAERQVPFVFATGYLDNSLPPRHATVLRCDKTIDPIELAAALFPG